MCVCVHELYSEYHNVDIIIFHCALCYLAKVSLSMSKYSTVLAAGSASGTAGAVPILASDILNILRAHPDQVYGVVDGFVAQNVAGVVDPVETKVAGVGTDLTAVQRSVALVEEDLSLAQAAVNFNESELTTLEHMVADVQSDVTILQTQVTDAIDGTLVKLRDQLVSSHVTRVSHDAFSSIGITNQDNSSSGTKLVTYLIHVPLSTTVRLMDIGYGLRTKFLSHHSDNGGGGVRLLDGTITNSLVSAVSTYPHCTTSVHFVLIRNTNPQVNRYGRLKWATAVAGSSYADVVRDLSLSNAQWAELRNTPVDNPPSLDAYRACGLIAVNVQIGHRSSPTASALTFTHSTSPGFLFNLVSTPNLLYVAIGTMASGARNTQTRLHLERKDTDTDGVKASYFGSGLPQDVLYKRNLPVFGKFLHKIMQGEVHCPIILADTVGHLPRSDSTFVSPSAVRAYNMVSASQWGDLYDPLLPPDGSGEYKYGLTGLDS